MLDTASFANQAHRYAAQIEYLALLGRPRIGFDRSPMVLTARLEDAPRFPTSVVVEFHRGDDRDQDPSCWITTDDDEFRQAHLGFWSNALLHAQWMEVDIARALVAEASRPFHGLVTADPQLLDVPWRDTAILSPQEALWLVGLKLRTADSIPIRQDGNTRWGLQTDHFLVARVHCRVANLRRFAAAVMSRDAGDDKDQQSDLSAAVKSIESRLVHLSLAEDHLGHAVFSGVKLAGNDIAYHMDHFMLLAQSLVENLKWLLGLISGVDPGKRWDHFIKALKDAAPELAGFLLEPEPQGIQQLVRTLRVPTAHQEHWPRAYASLGQFASADHYRQTLDVIGDTASALIAGVLALDGNPEDWGLRESASEEPTVLAIEIDPFTFVVHLSSHLSWLVNELLGRCEPHLGTQLEVKRYLDGMAMAHPGLDESWYPEVRMLDWPIPSFETKLSSTA
jgi:hypothetical protein